MKFVKSFIVLLFAVTVAFLFGFSFRDLENFQAPNASAFRRVLGMRLEPGPQQAVLDSYDLISTRYYQPVNPKQLKYAAISGMIGAVGDPHTVFMAPEARQSFDSTTSANFFGIGCELLPVPNGVVLVKVFDKSPAATSGLKPGDVVTEVNHVKIEGTASDQVVNRIKGPEGSVVNLTILPDGKTPSKIVSVMRERVFRPTVISHYFKKEEIGYLNIATFSDPTVDQFDTAVASLQQNPLKGLVIDVRGNPGGLLQSAANLIGRFVENKQVVRMVHADGSAEEAISPSGYLLNLKVPIVILIDKDSASAAEIFAGCMHDYGVATLVGTHSYGKNSVQNLFPMTDDAGVKITIAHYYLPVTADIGRKIDANGNYVSGGLKPDVEVEEAKHVMPVAFDPKTDAQLDAAIKILESKQ